MTPQLSSIVFLSVLSSHSCWGDPVGGGRAEEPIVLPPIRNGTEVALLMVPGAYINGAAYEPLGQAVQQASPQQVWVGLVRPFTNDLPNPFECSAAIEATLGLMRDMGMGSDASIVVSGHSLGGVVMQDWIADNLADTAAMVLMASALNNAVVADASLAKLSLSGDLDGLETIFEVEPVFRRLEAAVEESPEAMLTWPVIVAEDVNHMHFASGDRPPLVEAEDILSPLPEEEAHALLAAHMAAFITSTLGEPEDLVAEAQEALQEAFLDTRDKFMPLAEMRELTSSDTYSPFATVGQKVISCMDPTFYPTIYVNDTLYEDLPPFESHQPETTFVGDVLQVNTYSMVTEAGALSSYSSPEELAIKFKSSAALREVLEPLGTQFLDSNTTCLDVNQEAIYEALSSGGPVVSGRYTNRGRPIILLPDAEQLSGPEWLNTSVNYTETEAGLAVRAASLVTAVSVPFGFGGMNYCKLMPPSRALEYIMINSLRGTEP